MPDADWQNVGHIEGEKGSSSDDAIAYMAGKDDESLHEVPSTSRVAPMPTDFFRIDDGHHHGRDDELW